jgi:hypothetical protein
MKMLFEQTYEMPDTFIACHPIPIASHASSLRLYRNKKTTSLLEDGSQSF